MKIPLSLAKELNCSTDFLRKINRGERQPSVKMARKIVKALGGTVSLAELRPDLADLYSGAAGAGPAKSAPGAPPERPEAKAKGRKKKYAIDIYRAWCKGCGICAAFCPQKCISLNEEGLPVLDHGERCTGCGWCELHCPDFAISVREAVATAPQEEAD
jgi:2-oxoglutarate ferredoxin oxidoreductase subunit delta